MTLAIVSRETTPSEAAGALIFAISSGRVLLLNRRDGSGWSHPGGWGEHRETALQTAVREVAEETGVELRFTAPVRNLKIRVSERGYEALPAAAANETALIYSLFFVVVTTEFVPRLNSEHTGHTWADPDDIGPHLHPGCATALRWLKRNRAK